MREELRQAKRVIVKVGTSSLTHANGRINMDKMEVLVRQICNLANAGKEMILVSSGATAAGLPSLGFTSRPDDIALKQAAASVGQGILLHMYEKLFAEYGHTVGQILVTREDTVKRSHYLNLRNTLTALIGLGVIPIINENDVVAIDEFKIGDNDTLSANIASIIDADVLIILSDIEGLYTANPSTDSTATLIHEVEVLTPYIYEISGGAGSSLGTGGMYTKIQAAHISTNSGVHMVIASGEHPDSIKAIMNGEERGTHFWAYRDVPQIKKRWMAFGTRLQGTIYVDKGCRDALLTNGSSILPVGILSGEGQFEEGDTISIVHDGEEIARGIVNFNLSDLLKIKGHKSQDIPGILGVRDTYHVVVHRDNLVVLRQE